MTAYRVPGSPDKASRSILDFLMREDRVSGVFALAEVAPGRHGYALVTDRGLLSRVAPVAPVMPANGGAAAARLTVPEGPDRPVAAVLRPCELRALVELEKLGQARRENLLVISHTCSGVLPVRASRDALAEGRAQIDEADASSLVPKVIRDTCRICEQFVPAGADIVLAIAGQRKSDECLVLAATARGAEVLKGLEGGPAEEELDQKALEAIREQRAACRAEVLGRFESGALGLDGLVRLFGRCIGCHACSKACPVCYCNSCNFETADSEYDPGSLAVELERRPGIRLPVDTVYFQVGRMLHVGMSCVGCGMCSEMCPVDIPVAALFVKLAGEMQAMFDYVPGRDPDEKIPTATFKVEELAGTGE